MHRLNPEWLQLNVCYWRLQILKNEVAFTLCTGEFESQKVFRLRQEHQALLLRSSVADPACLHQIPDPYFSNRARIPDLDLDFLFFTHPGSRGQKGTGSRIRNPVFKCAFIAAGSVYQDINTDPYHRHS
jgi:hypothetical protein